MRLEHIERPLKVEDEMFRIFLDMEGVVVRFSESSGLLVVSPRAAEFQSTMPKYIRRVLEKYNYHSRWINELEAVLLPNPSPAP